MRTLSETSIDEAFATPDAARASIAHARAFTELHRQLEAASVAEREARLLAIQFPHVLQPPQPGDLFAGRIRYGIVGFSPEPVGLGYYCACAAIERWASSGTAEPDLIDQGEALVRYWKHRTTAARARCAFPDAIWRLLPSDEWASTSGVGFPLYRMAGVVPDYGRLLSLGLDDLEERAAGETDFARGCRAAIAVLRQSIDHYASTCGDLDLRDNLLIVRHQPPRTFRQAIQLFWLYALHSGTWNYGRLDDVLGPFLLRDFDNGTLGEARALDLLCSLWRLMHAYANHYNNRVIVGGLGRRSPEAADRFALLAIEATRRVRLNQPQLSLRFHKGQDPALWERAIDAIGEGCTFPILYNDDVNVPAVACAFAVPEAVAAQYTPFGCGEYVLAHHGCSTPNGIINLPKAVEVALHGGVDTSTGRRIGGIPPVDAMSRFEDVWTAYAQVVQSHVEALADAQRVIYEVVGSEAPYLFISLLSHDCLNRSAGAFAGGLEHLGGTLETYGNTNAADALHVIDELVFCRREATLRQLVAALDADWVGHDALRSQCLAVTRYGNDEATADAMALRVHDHVCDLTRAQAQRVGLDSYLIVIINNWANVLLGAQTGASADGRRAGEAFANGNNPSPGADTNGVTAFLNSLVRLSPTRHAGAVQNMKLSREWFGERRPELDALLRAYFASGGTQAMITVVSPHDLRAAMREPEKWGHLMVRVGGFSIRFVDLDPRAQQEVLQRTLH